MGLRRHAEEAAFHVEREAEPRERRWCNRRPEEDRLYRALPCAAVPARLLRVRTLLLGLRRQGAPGRVLHGLLDLGHLSGGEQPADTARARAYAGHDHCSAAEL